MHGVQDKVDKAQSLLDEQMEKHRLNESNAKSVAGSQTGNQSRLKSGLKAAMSQLKLTATSSVLDLRAKYSITPAQVRASLLRPSALAFAPFLKLLVLRSFLDQTS